jgi:hypothetical protein
LLRVDAEDRKFRRVEPRIDRVGLLDAPQEQRRRYERNERQRHLPDDERVAHEGSAPRNTRGSHVLQRVARRRT